MSAASRRITSSERAESSCPGVVSVKWPATIPAIWPSAPLCSELGEHAVDPVGGLADVLEHEQRASIVRRVRRAGERREEREVAADEPAARAAAADRARRGRVAERIAPLDHRAHERVAREVAELLARRRAVIGDELAARADGGVQRGDVGVAEQHARPSRERRVVEVREQTHRAVAATHAPDRVDGVVGERGVQVAQSLAVAPAEVVVAGEHVVAGGRLPAEGARVGDGSLELVRPAQWSRWRDEGDASAGSERWRKSHRGQRRERYRARQWGASTRATCGANTSTQMRRKLRARVR